MNANNLSDAETERLAILGEERLYRLDSINSSRSVLTDKRAAEFNRLIESN